LTGKTGVLLTTVASVASVALGPPVAVGIPGISDNRGKTDLAGENGETSRTGQDTAEREVGDAFGQAPGSSFATGPLVPPAVTTLTHLPRRSRLHFDPRWGLPQHCFSLEQTLAGLEARQRELGELVAGLAQMASFQKLPGQHGARPGG
jgi:hypothetical protein